MSTTLSLVLVGGTNFATDDAAISAFEGSEIEVSSTLVRESVSDSLQYGLQIIQDVEKMPTCRKIATSALLHSCSSLDPSMKHTDNNIGRGTDAIVDEESILYSTRLAVCELSGAGVQIPPACKSFVPLKRSKKKWSFGGLFKKDGPTDPKALFQYYEEVTPANLQACTNALSLTPQSWTSYSNSGHNGMVICRAMRSEIEKDELVHMTKILARTAAATSESNEEVKQKANEVYQQFHELVTSIRKLQMDLAASNEQQVEQIKQSWAELDQVHAGLQALRESVVGVNGEVLNAGAVAKALRTELHEATDFAMNNRDILASTKQNIGELSILGEEAKHSFRYLTEVTIREAAIKAGTLTQDIGIIETFMQSLQDHFVAARGEVAQVRQDSIDSLQEVQAQLNKTKADAEEISENLQEIKVKLGWLIEFMNTTWPNAFELIALAPWFVAYSAICSLLSYGAWESFTCYSFRGCLAASFATGLSKLASRLFLLLPANSSAVSASLLIGFEPARLYYCVVELFATGSFGIKVLAASGLTISFCSIFAAIWWIKGHLHHEVNSSCEDDGKELYDPASPTFTPTKWGV